MVKLETFEFLKRKAGMPLVFSRRDKQCIDCGRMDRMPRICPLVAEKSQVYAQMADSLVDLLFDRGRRVCLLHLGYESEAGIGRFGSAAGAFLLSEVLIRYSGSDRTPPQLPSLSIR